MLNLQGHWLCSPEFFDGMLEAYPRFEVDAGRFEAFLQRESNRGEREVFVRDGDTARVPVVGVLTARPDFFFSMIGERNSVYGDIIAGIQAAEGDPGIKRIVLEVSSPGGEIMGLFDAAAAVAGATKPTEAQVTDVAASAAFAIAAAADSITVNNPMAMVGSLGVQTTQFVSEERVTVRSSAAPKKNPDAGTAEGVAAIQAELDAVHIEFAGIIARGRGVSVADVNANYGQGAMMIASAALAVGMIDAISESTTVGGPRATGPQTEAHDMTLAELLAQHPEVYAQAVQFGRDQERDRVSAHVTMGAASPAAGILAASHILSGAELTSQQVQAGYMTAGRNAAEVTAHAAELEGAAPGTPAPAAPAGTAPDEAARADAVFDLVEQNMGFAPPTA